MQQRPNANAVRSMEKVTEIHSEFCVARPTLAGICGLVEVLM